MLIEIDTFFLHNVKGEELRDVKLKYFVFEGTCITDPHISDCTRFKVDPTEYYGLTKEEVEEIDSYNSWHYGKYDIG